MPSVVASYAGPPIRRRTFLAASGAGILAAIAAPQWISEPAYAEGVVPVYASMTRGAVVVLEDPGTTIVGAAPGLAIRPEGDVFVDDLATFLSALPFRLTTSAGSYELVADHGDYLNQEAWRDQVSVWFDAADQRSFVLSGDRVEEWADRGDPRRVARNDQYPGARPAYVSDSQAGADIPAVRFAPSGTSVHGLFFPDAPLFHGIQRVAFTSTNTLQFRFDNTYSPNVPGEAQIPFPTVTLSSPPVGQPSMLLVHWTAGGDLVYRLNGTEIGTQTAFGNGFEHDGLCALVFYAVNAGVGNRAQIVSATSVGNAYIWKESGFVGDLLECWGLIGVDA